MQPQIGDRFTDEESEWANRHLSVDDARRKVEPIGKPTSYEYRAWRGGSTATVDPRGLKAK